MSTKSSPNLEKKQLSSASNKELESSFNNKTNESSFKNNEIASNTESSLKVQSKDEIITKAHPTFQRRLIKLSEKSFSIDPNRPVNVRILFHAASASCNQMSSTSRSRKVTIFSFSSAC